jgi:type IX secretion system PorP/SprF family membrane protein
MKKYIIILVALLSQVHLLAQDPVFSQYFISPMTYNPALLGNDMRKDYKVGLLIRQKWWGENARPFTTNAISVEKQLTSNINYFNLMYVGLNMLNERSADGVLTNSYFGATLNDKIKIAEHDFLSTALSITYANRLVDLSAATFQSQFGSFGFMPTAVNYDPISLVSNKYFDLNAGLSFDHQGASKLDYQFGVGLFHVNKPGQSVLNNENYKLAMRSVIHGNLIYNFNNKDKAQFGTNLQTQGQDNIFTFGGAYTRVLDAPKNINITVGLWDRWNEAIYPYIGVQYNDIHLGLSYDIPPADIRNRLGSVNSLEASLTWDIGKMK